MPAGANYNNPTFQVAKTVTLDDAADNAVGACGIHNVGIAGLVALRSTSGTNYTIYLAQGAFAFCAFRRVLTTGTTVTEANLRVLY